MNSWSLLVILSFWLNHPLRKLTLGVFSVRCRTWSSCDPYSQQRQRIRSFHLFWLLLRILLSLCVKSIQAFLNFGYIELIFLLKFGPVSSLDKFLKSRKKFFIHLRFSRLEWIKFASGLSFFNCNFCSLIYIFAYFALTSEEFKFLLATPDLFLKNLLSLSFHGLAEVCEHVGYFRPSDFK